MIQKLMLCLLISRLLNLIRILMGEMLGDGIVASDVVNNPSEPEVPQPEVINQFNSPCTDVQIPQEVTSPGTHSIALEPLEQTQRGERNSTRGGRGQ